MSKYETQQCQCPNCNAWNISYTYIGQSWATALEEIAHCENCYHKWIQPHHPETQPCYEF